MYKNEAVTDLWVYNMLQEQDLDFYPQGSNIKEIAEALRSASKRDTMKIGYPEYTGIVKDYLIVIENKASLSNHEKRDADGLLLEDADSKANYAVNGAVHFGKHLSQHTSFKKLFALGVSGNEKRHKISPVFINERGYITELPELETFVSFTEQNIDEYYTREVLKEETNYEKQTADILKDAQELNEALRNYGNIQDKDRPLVVSGILLALNEIQHGNFRIDMLTGDRNKTDGQKIYDALESNLKRADVSPATKRDKLLNQFAVIKDTTRINEINENLGKTPLKYYAEFLYNSIYRNIVYTESSEDYLGRFYGEFMSYSGGDGQSLGIILTPKHITDLFCELLDIKSTDRVLDPCCGTGGFFTATRLKVSKEK